jgi:hypothetical protein
MSYNTSVGLVASEWVDFQFEFDGRSYVSRVASHCRHLPTILNMGEEKYQEMNQQCLSELLGTDRSPSEILRRLVELNKGGTEMFIMLA